MSPLRARVQKGRLVLDEPTKLPEGTVIELVADDGGDDLTEQERRALHRHYRHPGHPPRRAVYAPRRKSWTNCVDR